MSKLDEVIKNVNKKYGFNMVGRADIKKRNYARIPLVSPALTFLFRGGMPRTVIELLGMPSAGKSTLCYSICGSAQKILKQEHEAEVAELEAKDKLSKEEKERLAYLKDRGYKKVVYLDSEFSSDEDWMQKNGVDVDDLIFIAPENQTAEQLLTIISNIIRTY